LSQDELEIKNFLNYKVAENGVNVKIKMVSIFFFGVEERRGSP